MHRKINKKHLFFSTRACKALHMQLVECRCSSGSVSSSLPGALYGLPVGELRGTADLQSTETTSASASVARWVVYLFTALVNEWHCHLGAAQHSHSNFVQQKQGCGREEPLQAVTQEVVLKFFLLVELPFFLPGVSAVC